MNQYLSSGFEFTDSGPLLLLDSVLSEPVKRQRFYLKDKEFTLQRYSDTYCIGGFNLELNQFETCPKKARAEEGKELCPYCMKKSGFNPAFYNTDRISEQQLVYNSKPHVVYLVNFGIGYTKIGIARRVPRRWLEQGARVATVIKHCADAYEAREIEAAVNKELRIPEAFSTSQKRKMLLKQFDKQKATEEIIKIRDQIENLLPFKLENNPISFLDSNYLDNNPFPQNPIDTSKENDFISGKFIGLIGDTLLMLESDQAYLTSLKKFIGHLISIEKSVIPNKNRNDLQPSFDFI